MITPEMQKPAVIKLSPPEYGLLLDFLTALSKSLGGHKHLPPKFRLADEAFGKILNGKSVENSQVMGLLDVIGGAFSAAVKAEKLGITGKVDPDMLALMDLAGNIEKQFIAANYGGPKLVP
jgi:hypothetical protein